MTPVAGTSARRGLSMVRGLAALAAVLGGIAALRASGVLTGMGGGLFALGFLILAGTVLGSVAAWMQLPRITGYLVAGLLSGPQGFELFGPREVKALSLINGLALALIALQAGAELTVASLRRIWKSVLASSVAQVIFVVGPMAVLFFLLTPTIGFLAGLPVEARAALAFTWGVIALSRSPSVTLAVLSETKAKGPLSEHALGVIIFLDLVVLVLFTFAITSAKTVLQGETFQLDTVLHLFHELFASVAAGTTFGLLIALYFRFVRIERVLFLVVAGYAITAFTHYFHYETLLVFVVAGFVVMNLTKLGHDLVASSEKVSAAVMVVFFATVGATLDLEGLKVMWPIALVLVVGRFFFTYVATRISGRVADDPPVVRKYAFLTLTSQAGVGIALATIVRGALPGLGDELASLAIAVIAMNEVFGPAGLKLALSRAGEVRTSSSSTSDDREHAPSSA